ncbi:hypothetical protein MRB53_020172 [Persea americana]|uniref:Uncharacterized protein n=1 Tax=Persea americana TaxID=3435 RepID=A0ACC2L092_PERAE|nr:hypothetical protein MRB53_020172 [Persea americana]
MLTCAPRCMHQVSVTSVESVGHSVAQKNLEPLQRKHCYGWDLHLSTYGQTPMPNVQALLFGGVIGVRVAMKEELKIMSETKQNFYSWGSWMSIQSRLKYTGKVDSSSVIKKQLNGGKYAELLSQKFNQSEILTTQCIRDDKNTKG